MSRMGSGGGGGGGGKLASWLWRAPRRALGRARDLYVRSLTSCAGQFPGDAAYGYPSFPGTPMSCSRSADHYRSFSASPTSSSRSFGDSDLRELMRAASERRAAPPQPPAVPRSQSVAMGKIDEDRPCDFAGLAGAAGVAFGRSRSCAVSPGGHSRGRAAPVPMA